MKGAVGTVGRVRGTIEFGVGGTGTVTGAVIGIVIGAVLKTGLEIGSGAYCAYEMGCD